MANTLSLGSGNWGAKESLLLGYYENGGKFFPETFDVTRATGGTRVNKDGLIETPAEIGSEEITNGNFTTDSDWNKDAGWTISGGTANTDATINSKIVQNNVTTIGKQYKYSFDVLNSSVGDVRGRFRNNSGIVLTFFGDGTYSGYFTATDTSINILVLSTNTATFSIDNISVKEYNDKNLARIDYLDDAKGALLTEPQSTNFITHSSDFSNSSWQNLNLTVGLTANTNPSGNLETYKITEDNALSEKQLYFNIASFTTANQDISFCVFAKKGERDIIQLVVGGSSFVGGNQYANFDLNNGIVTAGNYINAKITPFYNGWYRCEITVTPSLSGAAINASILPQISTTASRTQAYQGDGTSGLYIFGAQLEKSNAVGYNGEYSTSYIPTDGSTVTRNQDEVNNGGDVNSFGSEEGVLFAEIAALVSGGTDRTISINDGSTNNSVNLYYLSTGSLRLLLLSGSSTQANITYTTDITQFSKIAFKWRQNDFSLWVDGVEVGTKSSGLPPVGLNTLEFTLGSSRFYGKSKNVQVFNTALSDSDLLSLTTTGSVPYWKQYSAMATSLNYTNK